MDWGQSNSEWNDAEANKLPEKVEELKINGKLPKGSGRKRLVVVGLGMVGVAFM
jgi:nitrite reductase (NAD(P)H)